MDKCNPRSASRNLDSKSYWDDRGGESERGGREGEWEGVEESLAMTTEGKAAPVRKRTSRARHRREEENEGDIEREQRGREKRKE
jgi:hypothetical protein